jgi:hypothetical protein
MTKKELFVAISCDCEDNQISYVPGWGKFGSDYDKNPAVLKWSWTQYWENISVLFKKHNIPITWLMRVDNGPVYDQMLSLFKDKVFELKSAGDEIGIHIHTWVWDAKLTKWIQTTNPDLEEKIVIDSLHAFKKSLGFEPSSVRMGWTTMSNEIMKVLNNNGLIVDTSATPYLISTGKFGNRDNIFDWSKALAGPYHPSFCDYQSPGDMKILEMPISSLALNKPGIFNRCVNSLSGRKALFRLVPIARRFNLTPHRHFYITPHWSSSVYAKIIKMYGESARKNGVGFLLGTFHSFDILDPRTGKRNMIFERYISRTISEILSIPDIQVKFMTLSQIAREFEEKSLQTFPTN